MKNTEITIRMSVKRKDSTRGATHTIHKDSEGTKWTSTLANGKRFKMSPEQLLSHLFKAIFAGKAIVEVVPDSPEKADQARLVCSARYDNQDKLEIGY